MMTSHHDSISTLLPVCKIAHLTGGTCRIAQGTSLNIEVGDSRVERAARKWWGGCPVRSSAAGSAKAVAIAVDRSQVEHRDGYRLVIRPDKIQLLGGSPAGCFYGLQTLTQLTDFAKGEAPCCVIDDSPDFATRGLLHDVTRGKAPTLDTLKTIADRLAALKVNQLQLYIEHAFNFAFDPDICGVDDGLTPDEIRELDAYCRERFIDLVPAVATLGHMGRILSMPKYRHLAEIEPTKSWEDMSWPERARGFTLDIMNHDSHSLVERIWSEMLAAFSSPVVNICGDEPWDLGKGKNRDRFAAVGTGPPYIDHILRTHALCAGLGRRTQVWSDVVLKHPELFERLPKDLTVLHWGYDDKADYEGTRKFTDAGLDTMVCPGTSGWKRILNAMNLAERNIAAFSKAGRRHGATGLLNTDWGDHGHFSSLACSWHGIALGAALAWKADHPTGPDFDRRFSRTVWGTDHTEIISELRQASAIAERCETWRLFWQPLQQIDEPTVPNINELDGAAETALSAIRRIDSMKANAVLTARDLAELSLACMFTELFAEKMNHKQPASTDFSNRLAAAGRSYADRWRARNKPSGLMDIVNALRFVGEAVSRIPAQMADLPNP